jgi:ERCC4-type nuclease
MKFFNCISVIIRIFVIIMNLEAKLETHNIFYALENGFQRNFFLTKKKKKMGFSHAMKEKKNVTVIRHSLYHLFLIRCNVASAAYRLYCHFLRKNQMR